MGKITILTITLIVLGSSAKAFGSIAKHSLDWPVRTKFEFSNSFGQLNTSEEGAYFHPGCDMGTENGTPVYTPVDGFVELGFYGYAPVISENEPTGRFNKLWEPLPKFIEDHRQIKMPWGPRYFEVAITNKDGYRFEFHHIDFKSLPETVINAYKSNVAIQSGQLIGHVINFQGIKKDHLHYNIISPTGEYLNCELFTRKLPDKTPPQLLNAYITDGQVAHLLGGKSKYPNVLKKGTNLILEIIDTKDDSNAVLQPPYVRIKFPSGRTVIRDLRRSLNLANSITVEEFYSLDTFYLGTDRKSVNKYYTENPDTFYQWLEGKILSFDQTINSKNRRRNLMLFPFQSEGPGEIEIVIKDISGNQSRYQRVVQ